MSQNEDKNINALETIVAVLKSGNSVELNAAGYSMFPTLRPGDRVIVKPLITGELPEPGCVVVCRDRNELVIHRLISIVNNTGKYVFTTRGDSRKEEDRKWEAEMVGVAVSFKRGKRELLIKKFVPRNMYYYFNRLALWLYFKLKKTRLVLNIFNRT